MRHHHNAIIRCILDLIIRNLLIKWKRSIEIKYICFLHSEKTTSNRATKVNFRTNQMDKSKVDPEKELSRTLITFIVCGGVFLLIFFTIFAKRQIMRFALRSRRGPHVPVGHDAGKAIKKEIERRLDCIQNISFDPQLLPDDPSYILQSDADLPPYYYRLKAVDDIKLLEKEIAKYDSIVRQPRESVRAFLLTSLLAAPMMTGSGQRLIHQFCDMYDHARHDPNEFGLEEYETYERLFSKLLDA